MADLLRVLIVHAGAGHAADEIPLEVVKGATIQDAVERSGLASRHPGQDLSGLRMGVWGKTVDPTRPVADGDRIEVYRPLTVDPKTARQRRAAKKQAAA